MNRFAFALIAVFSLAPLTFATPPSLAFLNLKKDTETKDESAEVQAALPEYNGVKHAIGVTGFDNEAGWQGRWELGENLGMMLESALFDSDRFVVVERQELGNVIGEQDLQASGRAAEASNTAQTGLIRSARYLATGSVTRVDQNTSGGSGGIGIGNVRVGVGSNKASIELVVKLVDTTSGQVVASKRISGEAGGQRLRLGFRDGRVGGDLDAFARTPIGEAAQDCISQAVLFIAQEMEDYEVTANIVMVRSNDVIIINRGSDYGVSPGQIFEVKETGEILTDPSTGEILEVFEGEVTCRIEVTRVSERVAYCKLVDGVAPERGDAVVLAGS